MRLIAVSDLHYNHAKSRPSAQAVIDHINERGCDVLLVIGDVGVADSDELEQCLARFRHAGPRLFVPGNHELWTRRDASHAILRDEYPGRLESIGWTWLPGGPYLCGDVAAVGSLGWYDYSFASPRLGIPLRFYARKLSPGVAQSDDELRDELGPFDDVPESARDVYARWNDGRFVRLHRSDTAFLDELLMTLRRQLDTVRHVRRIVAAVHHLPFAALLPPLRNNTWDFALAYLGSERIGQLFLEHPNLTHALCGHSHWPAQANVGHISAVNTGCGYRMKNYIEVDL
jgi:predicted phosphodiesterase